MHNLTPYINTVISKGFPEVANAIIRTRYSKMSDAYFEFERKSRFNYVVTVDTLMKNASKEAVIGGLAHEIAHIFKEVKNNEIVSKIEGIMYRSLPLYSTYDERKTDKLVIERGFGYELLAFVKHQNKKRIRYNKFDGLTENEIRRMLKL